MSESEERETEEPEASEPAAEATEADAEATEAETPEAEAAPDAETSEAETPEAESTDAEAPEAEAPEAETTEADEAATPAAAEEPEEATAAAEGQPEQAEEAPAEEPQAERSAKPDSAKEKKKDVVPGADLEPIAIEDEQELTAEERAAREAEEEERAAREAAATADDLEDEAISNRKVTVPGDAHVQATGKRKSAVARVLVNAGSGSFKINDRAIEEYFPSTQLQALARQPLVTAGYDGSVDVRVRVHGGGISGQAGAVRHGLARALTTLEPELRGELKRRGLLTRDDRRKERKKAGLKKARKRPQFSKR